MIWLTEKRYSIKHFGSFPCKNAIIYIQKCPNLHANSTAKVSGSYLSLCKLTLEAISVAFLLRWHSVLCKKRLWGNEKFCIGDKTGFFSNFLWG